MSNLPPGVGANDIPGNRPEDLAEERFWDALLSHPDLPESGLPEEWYDDPAMVKLVGIAAGLGYSEGYAHGVEDEKLATLISEEEQ